MFRFFRDEASTPDLSRPRVLRRGRALEAASGHVQAGRGGLGVEVGEMLHVGDREHNDVRGPHALGMKAILFTATRDRASSIADAICERAADVPAR